jgi:hypothetical protein
MKKDSVLLLILALFFALLASTLLPGLPSRTGVPPMLAARTVSATCAGVRPSRPGGLAARTGCRQGRQRKPQRLRAQT